MKGMGVNMKKGVKVLIVITSIIAVIVIAVTLFVSSIGKKLDAYSTFNYTGLDLSTVEDGTYPGSEDAGIIKVSLEVTVKDHVITDITIISHKSGQGKPAEVIVDDIVKANSLEVDAISGATSSSTVIKVAVYNALTK